MKDKSPRTDSQFKGVRLQSLNYLMIAVACLVFTMLIFATIHIMQRYRLVTDAMDTCLASQDAANMLMDGSDTLTEDVRMYVITLDSSYMDAYYIEANITQSRDKALDNLQALGSDEAALVYLQDALSNSDTLMNREASAMRLAALSQGIDESTLPDEVQAAELTAEQLSADPAEQLEMARQMVFDNGYSQLKNAIIENVNSCLERILAQDRDVLDESTAELGSTLNWQRILICILFILNVVTFVVINVLIIRPLRVYARCIEQNSLFAVTGSYEFRHLALTYNNIYELNATNKDMLRYSAEHDPLTGLYNRGCFDRLRLMFDHSQASGLLLVDIDEFKGVNDNYGHDMGDRVLKHVAGLLSGSFRATDYVARIGGDEFAVILTKFPTELTDVIERKIGIVNDNLLHPTDDMPPVSLSVGAAFRDTPGSCGDIYKDADSALYEVKRSGRCGLCFFGSEAVCHPGPPKSDAGIETETE